MASLQEKAQNSSNHVTTTSPYYDIYPSYPQILSHSSRKHLCRLMVDSMSARCRAVYRSRGHHIVCDGVW